MKNSNNIASGVINSDYILTHAQLQQLVVLIQSVSGSTSSVKLIKKMSKALQEVVPCGRSLVWIYQKSENILWTYDNGKKIKSEIEKTIAGKSFLSGSVLNMSNPSGDPLFKKETDAIPGASSGHLLCHPVIAEDGRVLAVIQLMNTMIHPVTPAMMNLVDEFSRIAAGLFIAVLKNDEIQKAFDSFVDTISRVLDTRDYITAGHSRRVTLYAIEVAKQMNLDIHETDLLRYAGLLHDIGKVGIPELILLKNKRPSDDEYQMLKRHAAITRNILAKIYFPEHLLQVVDIAATHHERINGTGYPQGLSGEQIPRGGKILAVCDVFDALTSRRPYEDRMPVRKIVGILDNEINESFEPFIVYHFKNIPLDRIIQILEFGHTDDMDETDLAFLKEYTLNELCSNDNIKSDDQEKLENVFDRYYSRQYRS